MRWRPLLLRSALEAAKASPDHVLAQAGGFAAGLLQKSKVGIGAFPQRKEILISHTAARRIAGQRARACYTEQCQNALWALFQAHTVIEKFLEFHFSGFAVAGAEIGQPPQVRGVSNGHVFALADVVGQSGLKNADGLVWVTSIQFDSRVNRRKSHGIQQAIGREMLSQVAGDS